MKKYDARVLAGGKGLRSGLGYNKVFYLLDNGKSVLENACLPFFEDEDVKNVVVVCNEDVPFTHPKMIICKGGEERKDSVYNGLKECTSEFVFIHDGARPYLNKNDLTKLKEAMSKENGAILASKAYETIKEVKDGYICKTLDRDFIYMAKTPQAFKRVLIKELYERDLSLSFTDDASVLEYYGYPVKVIEVSNHNLKLTNPEDFK